MKRTDLIKQEERKVIDCAFIFMLDEERDLFLKHNKHFILTEKPTARFQEFIFFDKNKALRKGVICSNGKEMGNTEACKLFYLLSRHYSASLYVNVGVAAQINDVNVGDVIIVNRLSTSAEHNDDIHKTQVQDYTSSNDNLTADICFELEQIINKNNSFINESAQRLSQFKSKLGKTLLKKYKPLVESTHNQLAAGWCLTVPQVIKDKDNSSVIQDQRKLNIVDMEAYYLASWYNIIKNYEPWLMQEDTLFLSFKSVSDYGDSNKMKFESAGSRSLAMHNLYDVVSKYCTVLHDYSLPSSSSLEQYFLDTVYKKCVDSIAANQNITKTDLESLFKFIIHPDEKNELEIDTDASITSLLDLLKKDNQALLLTGRSGTGKSTFISYLYKETIGNKVLIDFSKFSDTEGIVYAELLKELVFENSRFTVFLDGILPGTKTFDAVKYTLSTIQSNSIAFCLGNYDDSVESIATVLSSTKAAVNNYYFSGVNKHTPKFISFIEEWVKFCNKAQYKLQNIDRIKALLSTTKLGSVDLRLLNMFVDYQKELPKENLPVFIKNHCLSKYTETKLKELWEQYLIDSSIIKRR